MRPSHKIFFLLAAMAAFFLTGCRLIPSEDPAAAPSPSAPGHPAGPPISIHLLLGNPSNASATDRDNYLFVSENSAMSYNNGRGTLNWVQWKTSRDDLGDKLPRADFEPDRRLPPGFRRITTFDYIGSGYDRGHMVPSADRFADPSRNAETFYMTNIVPQAGELNQYPWNKLENYARGQARRGWDVYTIAGVYGEQERIKNKITVPSRCWKVIAFVRRGSDPGLIDEDTRIIAVDMPNQNGVRRDPWEKYRVTVRHIERMTGYDLFSRLPPEIQNVIENRVDGD